MPNDKATTDLTPPTKAVKAPKGPKEPKAAAPAAPAADKEATGAPATVAAEKKPRAPRTDYGFSPTSVIAVAVGKDHGYRGQRLAWYERILKFDGKTAEEFLKANDNLTTPKGSEDPPRGWLRFFVQDGSVTLSGGVAKAATAPSVSEPKKGDTPAEAQAA